MSVVGYALEVSVDAAYLSPDVGAMFDRINGDLRSFGFRDQVRAVSTIRVGTLESPRALSVEELRRLQDGLRQTYEGVDYVVDVGIRCVGLRVDGASG